MIGTDAARGTFGASTASRPIRTPSVTMQREPRNAPSSTITGRAPGGPRTPPIPTPPARGSLAPVSAPELVSAGLSQTRHKRAPGCPALSRVRAPTGDVTPRRCDDDVDAPPGHVHRVDRDRALVPAHRARLLVQDDAEPAR